MQRQLTCGEDCLKAGFSCYSKKKRYWAKVKRLRSPAQPLQIFSLQSWARNDRGRLFVLILFHIEDMEGVAGIQSTVDFYFLARECSAFTWSSSL